jgi:ABC-type transport system involved in cytochrome bd biosynthesis fused ATPase/permease subunit
MLVSGHLQPMIYKLISDPDLIIVLQNGRVVEQGTHDELVRREEGLYHSMWQQQNATEEAVVHQALP